MVRRIRIIKSPFSQAPDYVQQAMTGLELMTSDQLPPPTAKSAPLLAGDVLDPSAEYHNVDPEHFLTALRENDPAAEQWVRNNVEGLAAPKHLRLGEILTKPRVIFIRFKHDDCEIVE